MAKFTTSKFPSLIVKFGNRHRVTFESGTAEVSGEVAEALVAFADAHPEYEIEQVEADAPEEKPLTPKQQAVAKAEALGLDTSGSQKDIEARIAEHEADEDPDEDDADADDADDDDFEDDSDEDDADNA